MMRLKIKDIAQKLGIKNARQLADRSGINVTSCYQIWNGTAKMISFDVLNTLCNVLQAGPALLLEYTPDVDSQPGEPQSGEQAAPPRRSSGSSAKSRHEPKQSRAAVMNG
jgi:DNA-binding Xre family transcriptional regulator